MMKLQTKRILFAALLSGAILTQLSACSSPVIFHRNPISVTGTEDTDAARESLSSGDGGDTGETSASDMQGDGTQAEHQPDTPAKDPEEAARAALSALRDVDLDGMNYLIAASESAAAFGSGFSGDDAGSLVLPETRVKRTRMVEEKYNVRFLTFSYETEELYQEIRKAFFSDTQFFADFYAIPVSQLGRYQAAEMLFNLRSLPFTDFSKRYFNTEAMRAMSAGYAVYGAAGDYTFSPENYYAVYYNKTLHDKLNLDSPYTLVDNGTWTWDKLLSNAAGARTLLDRDGNAVYYGTNFSSIDTRLGESMVLASAGVHTVTSGLDKTPVLSADTNVLDALAAVAKNAFVTAAAAPKRDAYQGGIQNDDALFRSGKLLYYVDTLSKIRQYTDIDTNWGIVPLPKADDAQKTYYTYTGDSAVICVPSTLGAPESTGMLLQALFAASAGSYPDLYLNEALTYYVRDGKSVDMLELICQKPYFDFASAFASGYNSLSNATIYGFHTAVTQGYSASGMYRNYKTQATSDLQKAFGVGS